MTEYKSLREKIAAETAARKDRYEGFHVAFVRARDAGLAAGKAAQPRPMVVGNAIGLSNKIDPNGPLYHCAEGTCGFAWVRVSSGRSSFAKWLVKNGLGRKAYGGGVDIWISDHGQSIERKEAHARAMANVLRTDLQVECHADSRMD